MNVAYIFSSFHIFQKNKFVWGRGEGEIIKEKKVGNSFFLDYPFIQITAFIIQEACDFRHSEHNKKVTN